MPENNEEKSPVSFEEALQAAREQLAQEGNTTEPPEAQAEQAQQEPESGEGNTESGNPQPQDNPPDARTMYLQQSQQMAQMQQQMGVLMEQNRQLQEALSEQSRARETEVLEQAKTPEPIPELDLSNAWSEDEATIKARGQEYSQKMADYTRRQVLSEIEPYIASLREGMAENAKRQAIEGISREKGFEGIIGMTPALDRILSENPILAKSDAPIEDKLIMAYALAKGGEAIRTPQRELTDDDFMARYQNSPELQKRVEITRAQGARGVQSRTPPMSAGSGNASVPLTPPREAPKSFDNAKLAMLQSLGLKA